MRDKSKRAVNGCVLNGSRSYIKSSGVVLTLTFDDAYALNSVLNSEQTMRAAMCCLENDQADSLRAIGAALDTHVGNA